VTTVAGGVPIVVPSGLAAASAFGAPKVNVTQVPAGFAVQTTAGSVPIAIPQGLAVSATFGAADVSVPGVMAPTGFAVTAAFGNVPAVAPFGLAEPAAFGAPTITLTANEINISATGLAQAAAYGGVPLVIPAGSAEIIAFPTPSLVSQGAVVAAPSVLGPAAGRPDPAANMLALFEAYAETKKRKRREEELQQQQIAEREAAHQKAKRASAEGDLDDYRDAQLDIDRLDAMIMRTSEKLVAFDQEQARIADEALSYVQGRDVFGEMSKEAGLLAEISEDRFQQRLRDDDEEAILALL
jgi:hypothetical protein